MLAIKSMIARTIQQAEDLVLVFEYTDAQGTVSRRVVSPFRFVGQDSFLGLCLTKEEPRRFSISKCRDLKIGFASNYTMPLHTMEAAS